MKRKISLLMIFLLLIGTTAIASEVPQISDGLFQYAKQAMRCLSAGEYEKLVTMLPFADVAPSASEWQAFAEGNFHAISAGAQTEYAVAYWAGSAWQLAIPVAEPSIDEVEALILSSVDGSAFSGYRYATWAEVKSEYLFSPYVTWNQEYISSNPVVAVD